jgi:hypothetical protein
MTFETEQAALDYLRPYIVRVGNKYVLPATLIIEQTNIKSLCDKILALDMPNVRGAGNLPFIPNRGSLAARFTRFFKTYPKCANEDRIVDCVRRYCDYVRNLTSQSYTRILLRYIWYSDNGTLVSQLCDDYDSADVPVHEIRYDMI